MTAHSTLSPPNFFDISTFTLNGKCQIKQHAYTYVVVTSTDSIASHRNQLQRAALRLL